MFSKCPVSVKDVVVSRRNVLLRADLNVPVVNGEIIDDARILEIIPTIRYLLLNGAKIIIISHFSRPDGVYNKKFSLSIVADRLSRIMNYQVLFLDDCIGKEVHNVIDKMDYGNVVLLENLRFHKEEELNDPLFASELASLASIYVNEAFSCSHRYHASIVGVPSIIRSVFGLSFIAEINHLSKIIDADDVALIIGGSKISTKIKIIKKLTTKVRCIFVVGGIANAFLQYYGHEIGISLCDVNCHEMINSVIESANIHNCKIVMPIDVVTCNELKLKSEFKTKLISEVGVNDIIADIGQQTIDLIDTTLAMHKNVLCNGPFGVYEVAPFENGSVNLLKKIANRTKSGKIFSIAGGGDVGACIKMAGVIDDFTFVSKAGGAFLEFIAGNKLPGIEALFKDI